jgi:mitochondrial fission protein ELM1
MIASLIAAGRVRALDEPTPPTITPLDEAERVAEAIRARGWLG